MLRGRCMGTPSILASFVICLAANNLSAAAEVDPMQSAVSDNFAAGRETFFFFSARGMQKWRKDFSLSDLSKKREASKR